MMKAADLMRDDFVKIDVSDSVSTLIGRLVNEKKTEACVFDKKRFEGMFSHRALLKTRIDVKNSKISEFVAASPKLREDHDLTQAATLMFDSNLAALPVFRKEKFLGIVSAFDILGHIDEIPGLDHVRVKTIRHPAAITISEDSPVGRALYIMSEEHIDRLPVVDRKREIAGIITHMGLMERFYIHHLKREMAQKPRTQTKAFKGERPDILALPVKNFMSKDGIGIITAKEDETLKAAAKKMAENRVYSLIVPDGKWPRYIVTKRDLLEAIAATRIEELTNIQYIGLDELNMDRFTEDWVKKIASYYSEKIGFLVKNEFDVVVHIKKYKKAGKQHKYSVHLRVNYPGGTVASGKAYDWDIRRALHKGFRDLKNELSHRYKRNLKETPAFKRFFEAEEFGEEKV